MRPVCFIDRNIPLLAEALAKTGDIRLFDGRALVCADLLDSHCTALFVRSVTRVNEELLAGTGVRFVATATAGADHIDEDYLENSGVAFASAPGSNSNSVAEYVIFSLLRWADFRGISLAGRRLGVVGFGNIGRKTALYASEVLGMEVWLNDPPLREAGFVFPAEFRCAELDDVCRNCDAITNHTPLHGGEFSTENLFDGRRIGLLPDGGLFIHASRGGIADENALVRRLAAGEIAAVCDVFRNEPAAQEDLVRLALIATPHIAGYSFDAKALGARMVGEAFCRFMNFPPPHFPEITPETGAYFPENLLATLAARRRLDEDSAAFKATMLLPAAERPAAFDALRRNYPLRRETLG